MAMMPLGETVTILRPGTITYDIYGNDAAGPPTEIDVLGCAFAPGATGETVQGQDQVVSGPTLFAPHESDIRPSDQIRIRGAVFEVDGAPSQWRSPFTGWQAGLQIPLRRVTG